MPWDDRIKRRLKLRDLETLMAVVEAGSMGKAAERLKLFQPAISKSIADLEAALGVRLVDRSRRGVEPTPYGLALIRRGASAFDELKQGVQEVEFLADPAAGELRVGGSDPAVGGILPAIIDRISRKHPRVVFRVIHGSSDRQLIQSLRERDVDMIVCRLPHAIETGMHGEVLFNEPLLVAAGESNPWTRRRRVELRQLIDEPWVLPRTETWVGSLVAGIFRANGLDLPRNAVFANSMQLNHALLATGRYLAIFSNSFLQLSGKRLAIRTLPVRFSSEAHPFGVMMLQNRTISPIAQVFIAQAREISRVFAKAG